MDMDDTMMDDMHMHDDHMHMDDEMDMDMDMNMDDEMDMDMDMNMEMTMTFQDWDEYKVTILWDSWEVKEKWQYALSWFAIVFAAAFFHIFRWAMEHVKKEMFKKQYSKLDSSLLSNDIPVANPPLQWRIAHALLAGASYGYALMLMLVAMTYNPGLLCALMTGYAIGDFFFPPTAQTSGNQQAVAECCS